MKRKKSPSTTPGTGTHTPSSSGIFGRAAFSPGPDSPKGTHSVNGDSISSMAAFTPISDNSLPSFSQTVDLIRSEHYKAAQDHIRDDGIRKALEAEIDADCDWLRSFLFASRVIDEISLRAKDSIIGRGERMACKLMTAVLHDHGVDAEYVSLDDIVPSDWNAEDGVLGQDFYDEVAKAVGERVKQCGSRVPVVTGMPECTQATL
jgi:aspartate kinase